MTFISSITAKWWYLFYLCIYLKTDKGPESATNMPLQWSKGYKHVTNSDKWTSKIRLKNRQANEVVQFGFSILSSEETLAHIYSTVAREEFVCITSCTVGSVSKCQKSHFDSWAQKESCKSRSGHNADVLTSRLFQWAWGEVCCGWQHLFIFTVAKTWLTAKHH